jgi:hypothetical protein
MYFQRVRYFVSVLHLIVWISVCSLLSISSEGQTAASGGTEDSATQPVSAATINSANKSGLSLTTISDLSASVGVESVLLPYSVVKRTLGKEIAEKYAVVSLIVANRDQKQGMILHSVMLDYSRWLFSGSLPGVTDTEKVKTELWEQQNSSTRVASAEVRTVRGDYQDAQLWNARNWIIHIATAVGATAGSLSYTTANDLFAPTVAVFNGSVVPAIGMIWPDNSQSQLNLLNDVAFRTNHVVAAKSSDIVIAFFPMDRFITPTLQKIYKEAPAAFFNPAELIFENPPRKFAVKRLNQRVGKLLEEIEKMKVFSQSNICTDEADHTCKTIQEALAVSIVKYQIAYDQATRQKVTDNPVLPCDDPKKYALSEGVCHNIALLNRISLNNIRVIVGGIMTVDVSTVPATIASIQIVNENDPATWKSGHKLGGTIAGSFLSGGTISISGTDSSGGALDASSFGTVQIDRTTASDSNLPFSITFGKDIAAGSKLSFLITKVGQDKSTTVSSPFTYVVMSDPILTVDTKAPWKVGASVTGKLSGTGLADVKIQSVSGKDASGNAIPVENFTPSIATKSDTAPSFSIKINTTDVLSGSELTFLLSLKHPDGSFVSLTYKVP